MTTLVEAAKPTKPAAYTAAGGIGTGVMIAEVIDWVLLTAWGVSMPDTVIASVAGLAAVLVGWFGSQKWGG